MKLIEFTELITVNKRVIEFRERFDLINIQKFNRKRNYRDGPLLTYLSLIHSRIITID